MEGPLSQGYQVEKKPAFNPFCYVSKVYILIVCSHGVYHRVCEHSSEHESMYGLFLLPTLSWKCKVAILTPYLRHTILSSKTEKKYGIRWSVFRSQETSERTSLNGDKISWQLSLREGAMSLKGRRLLECGTKREQKLSEREAEWSHRD